MITFNHIFWFVAIIISGLLGWKSIKIFTDVFKKKKEDQPTLSWKMHQRWFNFIGSLTGWGALWILSQRYWNNIFYGCPVSPNLWDLLCGFIAFVGITGYLPFTVYGIISSVSLLLLKAIDLFKDWLSKPSSK